MQMPSEHFTTPRRLGATGLSVSALGFGGAAIGNLYREVSDGDAFDAVRAAFEAGVCYFDTAPHYGFGLSESRLGSALRKLDPDESAVVSTKVGRTLVPCDADPGGLRHGFARAEPFAPVFDYSYDAVMRGYEESLSRLNGRRPRVVFVHDLGRRTHGEEHPRRFREFFEGGWRALETLRRAGEIEAIGLGANEWEICDDAMDHGDFDVFLLAGRYTLLEQTALDSFLPRCTQRNVSLIVGGPFNSGVLATGSRGTGQGHYDYGPVPKAVMARVRRLEDVCDAFDVPLPAAALQFVLAHPQVASVVPGLASSREVEQAAAWLSMSIPAAFWTALHDQALLHSAAPVPSTITIQTVQA